MLERGRGVPVRMDLMPNAKWRWTRFENVIQQRQSEIEFGHSPNAKDHLTEDIGNAVAAVNTLLRIGVPSADDSTLIGIAYKDSADWFEKTRAAFVANSPDELDTLFEVAHVVFQNGVERIYDIDEAVIVIPELSEVGVFPVDDQAITRRLREIVTERLGLPETSRPELPPGGTGFELS